MGNGSLIRGTMEVGAVVEEVLGEVEEALKKN